MPLGRAIGGSLEYGHPDLYKDSGPATILQDVTMASMTGTLAQIGLLSHYATEMFRDMFSITDALRARRGAGSVWFGRSLALQVRTEKATERCTALLEQLPDVCARVAACDGNTGGGRRGLPGEVLLT